MTQKASSIEAPITRVTVYRNGALVARRGEVTGDGPLTVEVRGLSLLLNSDSVRVRPENGTARDLEELCSLDAATAPPSSNEAELRKLRLEVERLEVENANIQQRCKHYDELTPLNAGKTPSRQMPDARVWLALQDFGHQRRMELTERQRKVDQELDDAQRKLSDLVEADRGDRRPPRFTRGLRFTLDTAGAFEIEYFVPAARWVPTYTLTIEDGDARLTVAALVAQATGEDWEDVEMVLATADLARETTLPELASWRLGRAQPQRPAFRPLPKGLEDLFSGYDRAPVPPPDPSATLGAVAVAGAGSAVIREPLAVASVAFGEEMLDGEEPVAGSANLDDTGVTFAPSAPAAPPVPAAEARPAARMRRATFAGGADREVRSLAPKKAAKRPPVQPPEPLPPRLRYAYLRLMGPDQSKRGQLIPVDPIAHLWALVEDHQTAQRGDLRRAVTALKNAANRLHNAPTPNRTTPLDGTNFHHVYSAEGRHSLESDGVFHRLTVTRLESPATIEHRAVPRESDETFRFCRLELPTSVPFPQGPLQVYENGSFRVTSSLSSELRSAGAIDLNLGVEQGLRIVDRTVDIWQEEKGMMTQKSRVEHRIRFHVRSALRDPARVVVYDRLPTPDDKDENDIDVHLMESVPKATKDDRGPDGKKLPGGLHWELDVKPGEKVEVSYLYEISLPAKMELQGGNRRE